jgi:hypothetical protein
MLLIYDHDNVLHITNERGLRWNYDKADKPQFSFDYDFLFFISHEDMYEIELGDDSLEITDEQKAEIEEYVNLCEPPLSMTLAKQYVDDIQNETLSRIDIIVEDIKEACRFIDRADMAIAGREGSQDPRRQIARRVMEWMDFAHGLSERIGEELRQTLDEDLKDFNHYSESVAELPRIEHFLEEQPVDERFNTDTLDINEGEDDLGEDKRAV